LALTATVFNVDLTRRTVTTEREGRALFERALGDPALVLWNTRDMVRHPGHGAALGHLRSQGAEIKPEGIYGMRPKSKEPLAAFARYFRNKIA